MLSLHKKEDSFLLRGEYLMSICSVINKIGKPGKVSHFEQLKSQLLDIGFMYAEKSQRIRL